MQTKCLLQEIAFTVQEWKREKKGPIRQGLHIYWAGCECDDPDKKAAAWGLQQKICILTEGLQILRNS